MAKHYNVALANNANRIFGFKSNDTLSSEVSPIIQPVVNLLNSQNIVIDGASTTSGTITLFTTPTDKDFYLCNAQVGLIKDATCDMATARIELSIITPVLAGAASRRDILAIPTLTLTAQSANVPQAFNPPIRLARGTSVQVSGSFTAGACSRYGGISGYTMETAAPQI